MTRPPAVPASYRGRDRMSLLEFIEDVESEHFRTNSDTGANHNALFIWNLVRNYAGFDSLTHDDLSQRHADSLGITLEAQKENERKMKRVKELVASGYTYHEAFGMVGNNIIHTYVPREK